MFQLGRRMPSSDVARAAPIDGMWVGQRDNGESSEPEGTINEALMAGEQVGVPLSHL